MKIETRHLALSAILGDSAEKQILILSSANLEGLSEQMARELSEGMHRFSREVTTLAVRDRFRDPNGSVQSMREALDEFNIFARGRDR